MIGPPFVYDQFIMSFKGYFQYLSNSMSRTY